MHPAECIPLSAIQATLQKENLRAILTSTGHATDHWVALTLSHSDGREIAFIERNPVEEGTLGSEELVAFADEITGCISSARTAGSKGRAGAGG
jgi:hypothetical protein